MASMSSAPDKAVDLHLHTYFRSSCSARIRTAASLKRIPLTSTYINLLKNEQTSPSYSAINPCQSVPTLTVTPSSPTDPNATPLVIRQSIAILEYLEEAFPETLSLLPPAADVTGRAKVREMVNIIAADIQPPTNLRILSRVRALGGDGAAWAKEIMSAGLAAYETVAREVAGKYSYRDSVTLADVCLAPAVEGALRWGVDMGQFPVLWGVFERVRVLEEFRGADWRRQEDTPAELREE